MSGLILPDELSFPETDISIPSFIQVNPDGTVGLNYLGLVGNALAQPQPRYWGMYDAPAIGSEIIPRAQVNNGDLMTLIAKRNTIAPLFPNTVWDFLAIHNSTQQNPIVTWLFKGGPPLLLWNAPPFGFAPPANTWIADGNLGTITIPATGNYKVDICAWLSSGTGGAESAVIGLWSNGAILASFQGASVPGGGYYVPLSFTLPISLTKGDVVTIAYEDNAGNAWTVNQRTLAITPNFINNLQ